ncbi:universal stress protein [Betaproteobacteria bacterium GR16-43]|nr:universal stress protein [Betaproteobacteria bacterium GR16-43]
MYKKILLAYDGSLAGQKALLDCQEVAQMQGSETFLVAVMPQDSVFIGGEGAFYDPQLADLEKKKFQGVLAEGLQRLSGCAKPATGELLVGHPVDAIASYAKKIDADLIVVGHKHQQSWAKRWWSGSVSKTLIEHAPCSVLVVITG